MHDLNDMLIFANVVKAKSFSGAARRLDTSKSSVSKAVSRLEAALVFACCTEARAGSA